MKTLLDTGINPESNSGHPENNGASDGQREFDFRVRYSIALYPISPLEWGKDRICISEVRDYVATTFDRQPNVCFYESIN